MGRKSRTKRQVQRAFHFSSFNPICFEEMQWVSRMADRRNGSEVMTEWTAAWLPWWSPVTQGKGALAHTVFVWLPGMPELNPPDQTKRSQLSRCCFGGISTVPPHGGCSSVSWLNRTVHPLKQKTQNHTWQLLPQIDPQLMVAVSPPLLQFQFVSPLVLQKAFDIFEKGLL